MEARGWGRRGAWWGGAGGREARSAAVWRRQVGGRSRRGGRGEERRPGGAGQRAEEEVPEGDEAAGFQVLDVNGDGLVTRPSCESLLSQETQSPAGKSVDLADKYPKMSARAVNGSVCKAFEDMDGSLGLEDGEISEADFIQFCESEPEARECRTFHSSCQQRAARGARRNARRSDCR